jgi:acyl-coenzyme A thioesterase PaaI-like protein
LTSDAGGLAGPAGGRRLELAPHNCFACGALNEHGLQLTIHVEAGRSWTDVVLEPRFEGWRGVAHGGILATILDEVMAWALVGEDNWGVTARLAVDFRHPAEVGQAMHAEGWVTKARRRLVESAGRIVAADGTELATATGLYVAADERRRRELREQYGFRLLPQDAL